MAVAVTELWSRVKAVRQLRNVVNLVAGVAMLLCVALAYRPAKDAALVWDDHVLVTPNTTALDAPLSTVMLSPFWPETPLADARAPYYRPLVVLCHHGGRSARVTAWLRAQGIGGATNLGGGIDAWSRLVDASVPTY